MKAFKSFPAIALLLVSSTVFAASSNDVSVLHYEPLQRLSIGSTDVSTLSFDALGRTFDVQLEPNDRLLSSLSRDIRTDGIGIYRGRLAGHPDSWVRIVVYDGMPRGVIWDGEELFAVEAPGDSLLQTNTPVIYRLADTVIAPGTMSCGVGSSASSGAVVFEKLMAEVATAAAQAPGAVTEITMGAIGDSDFTNNMGGDGPAALAITTRLNNVDGYFSEQVGVQIRVTTIETFSDPADDPFGPTANPTDPSTLLDEVATYRQNTPAQNANGLTHLYTGRDLTGTTVGIAYRGALCNSFFGAGLSEGSGNATFDSLVAAHEIGHNFGAEHDGEIGTPCEADTGDFIMSPSINGVEQFSACSVAIMEAEAAAATSCVAPLDTVDMSVALNGQSGTVLLGANTALTYDVSNNGIDTATGVTVDFTVPVTLSLDSVSTTLGTCTSGAGVVNCLLGDVPGLSSNTIVITTTPIVVGVGMLTADVAADFDERASNNQDVMQLTVDPAVDLVVNTPSAPSIKLDQSTTISALLENRSVLPAIGATLNVSLSFGLQIDSVSWPDGVCTITGQQIDCLAANFAAQSSSTLSVGVTAVAAGNKVFTVTLSSNEADADPGNNSVNGAVKVKDPDEGGGATGLLFLCLLSMIAALSRTRSFRRV